MILFFFLYDELNLEIVEDTFYRFFSNIIWLIKKFKRRKIISQLALTAVPISTWKNYTSILMFRKTDTFHKHFSKITILSVLYECFQF